MRNFKIMKLIKNNEDMKNIIQLLSIANRIKTPISIISLVVIILYLIFKQILELDIFTKVGEKNTYLLLDNILNKIFWFAIIVLVFGVLLYILSYTLKNKNKTMLKSNVKLLSSTNDSKMSDHKQTIDSKGKKIIKPN